MQFTITSTGLLRNWNGRRICHISELADDAYRALRQLGVDPATLTARQRRASRPRLQAPPTDAELAATLNAANPWNPPTDAAPAMHPDEQMPAMWEERDLNTPAAASAAPGDVVLEAGVPVGTVGLNGRNEAICIREANPMHDRLRRPAGDPILANLATAYAGATTLPNPAEATEEELRAALGRPVVTGPDAVTNSRIRAAMEAGLNMPPDLQAAHTALRGPLVTMGMDVDGTITMHTTNPAEPNGSAIGVEYDRASLTTGQTPGIIGALNSAMLAADLSATTGTSLHEAMEAMDRAGAGRANLAPNPEPEVYVGPRMLATIAQPPASAERFSQHTADAEHAHLRAGQIYHQRPALYGSAVRRASTEAPNGAMVDRNAAAITTFLSEGYGIELNEEALSAVTAMANTFTRQAALPHIIRADGLQANVTSLDTEVRSLQRRLSTMTAARDALQEAARERDADAQHRGTIVDGVITTSHDPGPVEAAVAAAKAWKETGHEDSVAKLASFTHLLDTLETLAR
jgi:hypothetical protein